MLTIEYQDKEYELATTLRVAYLVQGQHNHKSYLEVFEGIGNMTLEQQIGIVYASLVAANREEAKNIKQSQFLDWFLDHYDISELMHLVQKIVEGIMGKEIRESATSTSDEGEGTAKNFL